MCKGKNVSDIIIKNYIEEQVTQNAYIDNKFNHKTKATKIQFFIRQSTRNDSEKKKEKIK